MDIRIVLELINKIKGNSDLKLWLKETWTRLRSRSPKYFRTTGRVNIIIGLIGTVFTLIQEAKLISSPLWLDIIGYIVTAIGWWGKLNVSLAVKPPAEGALPFTEKKHIEEVLKKSIINPVPNDKVTN